MKSVLVNTVQLWSLYYGRLEYYQ